MKTPTLLTTIAMAFLMLFSLNATAQDFSGLDKSPMDVAAFPTSHKEANKLIKVVYSRPQLKERSLDKLAPNGKVWRTGANESSELTLYTDMMLGSTKISAGTYSLYTIPGEKEWTIIISKDLNDWGSYSYNENNDVARITVPVGSSKKSIEAFSIAFKESDKGVDMFLGWDTTVVAVPFTK
jgi:hypothetical protein